jgi:hypothetical protein
MNNKSKQRTNRKRNCADVLLRFVATDFTFSRKGMPSSRSLFNMPVLRWNTLSPTRPAKRTRLDHPDVCVPSAILLSSSSGEADPPSASDSCSRRSDTVIVGLRRRATCIYNGFAGDAPASTGFSLVTAVSGADAESGGPAALLLESR